MKATDILIGGLVVGGGYLAWKHFSQPAPDDVEPLPPVPPPPPGDWQFAITCYVFPQGKTVRLAKADEVEVAIQFGWGFHKWSTEPKWIARTDGQGVAAIYMSTQDMRFGEDGKYRAWCVHRASGAVVSREIHLDDAGKPTFFAPVLEDAGNEMPQEFAIHIRGRSAAYIPR